MEITLLAFAQARETFGFSSRVVDCRADDTPRSLLQRLAPEARLDHLRVALDCEYTNWDAPLGTARELALLPPVSGG